MSSQPHDLMNSAASSAGDIPAKMGQLHFTTGCIPMAAICSGVVALVGAVIFGLWHRGHRAELQKTKKEEQDNTKRVVAKLQEQIRGLEEMRDQLNEQLEKVEAEKKEEQDNTKRVVATLQVQFREVEEMRDLLFKKLEKVEAEKKENKEKLQSVEMEITERENIFENTDELLRDKENLLQAQWKLDETKRIYEELKIKTEKLCRLAKQTAR